MKKKPILTAFVDGLKPSSLEYMPFLASFQHKRRLRTDLGYSITCHATMYSGLFPDKHGMWFLWKYSPETSPFRWLPKSRLLRWIDYLPTRYAVAKMTRIFSDNSSFGGLSVMRRSALPNWCYFDLAEKKMWDEPGYLGEVPTIFDILRENGIPFTTVGLLNGARKGGAISHIAAYQVPAEIDPWTYLFIGEVDEISHFHTQESIEAIAVMRKVDRQLERIYKDMSTQLGYEPYFFCFSDHGHMRVEKHFDIYEHFSQNSSNLDDFLHIIDTNFARFWFRNGDEERVIMDIMKSAPSGYFLTEKHFKKYHTSMTDNRYGDAIYYLDAPFKFKKTVWGYGTRTVSIHGYLPDYPEKDGVFVSNVPISKSGHVELVDILPSFLNLMQIKQEYQFDGCSIW